MGIGLEPGVRRRVWDLCVWSGDGRGDELGGEVYFYGPREGVEHVRETERGGGEAIAYWPCARLPESLVSAYRPTPRSVSALWLRRKV